MNTPLHSSAKKPIKKAYAKPKLVKHGKVARLTLKGGSSLDMLTGASDFQA